MILDVLVPALFMLSPFALMAIPDDETRRRRRRQRVPGPVGPLGVWAATRRGNRTIRRLNRERRARARAHIGRHRALVVAQ